MIYLLENKEGQWFKNFSYYKTKGNHIAEAELTDDAKLSRKFDHKKDAEDYINQQTHRVFTSQEFVVTEYELKSVETPIIETELEIIEKQIELASECYQDSCTSEIDKPIGVSGDVIKNISQTLYDNLFGYRDSQPERPRSNPVLYSLVEVFKDLKFGRTGEDRRFLQKCIDELSPDKEAKK